MALIYMDHHATTPVDPRVMEAMRPWFTEKFANAASRQHGPGREAAEAVERARGQVAALMGADPSALVFTSGATESDNLAIKGAIRANRKRGNHLVTLATEHHAVLDACRALERDGEATLTVVPVQPDGLVDPATFAAALTDRTVLASVMTANNEIGVIQPVAELAKACRERRILFHTDAAQALGRIPVDVDAMNLDLVSVSAHKVYGPKGVGALFARKRRPRVRLAPLQDGGGHERGLRSGTLPVPLIVGFGEACAIAAREMEAEAKRIRALRERLKERMFSALDRVHLNGAAEPRLPGNLNVGFEYVEGERLIGSLGDVAVSSAAACSTASPRPSHVLLALGVREDLAHASIRFGLGRTNTEAEIDAVADRLVEAVRKERRKSPIYGKLARI